jgi:UDP-N-acetylmuramoylalanine--D-glutamate ligase
MGDRGIVAAKTDMNMDGKNVLIVGLGRSGAAAARFAAAKGARVTVNDAADPQALAASVQEMTALGIPVIAGSHPVDVFTGSDLIVLSPGVPHTLPPVQAAAEAGIPVIGELALACRYVAAPMVAVTGTNGKTTVTTMIGDMLQRSGQTVFVGGNIGAPLIGHVASGAPVDTLVVEVSSFQLDTAPAFRPRIGVLLNITEDHLDRYPDFAAYAAAKGRIFACQGPGDMAVFNAEDGTVRDVAAGLRALPLPYARRNGEVGDGPGARYSRDAITVRLPEAGATTFDIANAPLAGDHNRENMCAAVTAALAAGGEAAAIQSVLDSFGGLPHRLETVGRRRGVRYINDSKATNVDAVRRALEAVAEPVVLIMGGRDKGGRFKDLAGAVRQRVKHLIAVGEARRHIAAQLNGCTATTILETLEDGVAEAARRARAGDAVLLSPGCASFDAFASYAQRGDTFRDIVEALP